MIAPILAYFFSPSTDIALFLGLDLRAPEAFAIGLGLIHTLGSPLLWWAGHPCGIIAWHSSTNCPELDFPTSLAPNQQAHPAALIACPGEAGCGS